MRILGLTEELINLAATTLHIKNMVCNRCIRVVTEELTNLGLHLKTVELGEAVVEDEPDDDKLKEIDKVLKENGFELIDDRKGQLIDHIKTVIIELIHYRKEMDEHINFSDFISKEVGYDYSYLSNLFSSVEGTTIEKYIIHQKIEKAKELLVYDELTLSEIAWQMGYSSVQHLSRQFKKVTGLTPSHFKKVKENRRKPLDEV